MFVYIIAIICLAGWAYMILELLVSEKLEAPYVCYTTILSYLLFIGCESLSRLFLIIFIQFAGYFICLKNEQNDAKCAQNPHFSHY